MDLWLGYFCRRVVGLVAHILILSSLYVALTPAYAASPLQSTITASNAITVGRNGGEPDGITDAKVAPLSDSEKQGFGCLSAGFLATGMTWFAGSNELIMVVAGGTLAPTTPIGAAVAITGTVFASVCAVGALITPAVLRMWNYTYFDLYGATPADDKTPATP